jgi:hypothetical protein
MANPPARAGRVLNVLRSCEPSRLETQVVAAAYECLTPLLKRHLPNARSKRGSAQCRAATDHRQRQAGGNQA